MEAFVENLVRSSDLEQLTKKAIRQQYCQHVGKHTMSHEEKDRINGVIEEMIIKLTAEKAKAEERGGKSSQKPGSDSKENLQPRTEGRITAGGATAASQSAGLNGSASNASKTSFHDYYKRLATNSRPMQILVYPSPCRQIFQSASKATRSTTHESQAASVVEDVRQKEAADKVESEELVAQKETPQIIPPSGISEGSAPPSENDEEGNISESEREEESNSISLLDNSNSRPEDNSGDEDGSDASPGKVSIRRRQKYRKLLSESESETPQASDVSEGESDMTPKPLKRKTTGKKAVALESSDEDFEEAANNSQKPLAKGRKKAAVSSEDESTESSEDEILADVKEKKQDKRVPAKTGGKRKKAAPSDSDSDFVSTGRMKGKKQKQPARQKRTRKQGKGGSVDSDSDFEVPTRSQQKKGKAKAGTSSKPSKPASGSESEMSSSDENLASLKKSARKSSSEEEVMEVDEPQKKESQKQESASSNDDEEEDKSDNAADSPPAGSHHDNSDDSEALTPQAWQGKDAVGSDSDSDAPVTKKRKKLDEDSDDSDSDIPLSKRNKKDVDDSDGSDSDVPVTTQKKKMKDDNSDSDVPLSKQKKPKLKGKVVKSKQKKKVKDDDSESTDSGVKMPEGKRRAKHDDSDSSDSDVPLALHKRVGADDSDDDSDVPLKKMKKTKKRTSAAGGSDDEFDMKHKGKMAVMASDSSISSDSDAPLKSSSKLKQKKQKGKEKKKSRSPKKTQKAKLSPHQPAKEFKQLEHLRKICRMVGIILRNTIELKECETDSQKVSRIKELLKKAGMKGTPTLKKIKALKLAKEAAELDLDNIIDTSGTGRPRRGQKQDRPPPPPTISPGKGLSNLRGIIDSEASDSD